ncbi:putative glyoxalase superfamily protein PhnB [Paludibacterium purpuratum]|uniref:Putative glyoxalase superfamily protein PhnB n=2 Tax=Paludibacterium purpuratum TaxID=1144873 RepID=A0A4R7BFD7_9NEIS|nr:putative glyoxalase superfamily protein PhnB [Paludibacterium purpuratum]
MSVKAIPDGFQSVVPYLAAQDASALIAFLQQAFDAQVCLLHKLPSGHVLHAQVRVGDCMVMTSDPQPKSECKIGPAMLYMYVADVDAAYRKAVDAGGKSLSTPADMFYGDRSAGVEDPAGNQWYLATHIEDVPEEELIRRVQTLCG